MWEIDVHGSMGKSSRDRESANTPTRSFSMDTGVDAAIFEQVLKLV
jgi:hypothetical protein